MIVREFLDGPKTAVFDRIRTSKLDLPQQIWVMNEYTCTVRPDCAAALYLVPRKMTMFLGSLGNLSRGPQLHLVHIYGLFKSYEQFNIKVL